MVNICLLWAVQKDPTYHCLSPLCGPYGLGTTNMEASQATKSFVHLLNCCIGYTCGRSISLVAKLFEIRQMKTITCALASTEHELSPA